VVMKKVLTGLLMMAGVLVVGSAFAEDPSAAEKAAEAADKAAKLALNSSTGGGMRGIGAGLAIGLAAFGGAFGQGKAAGAALEGSSRNPQANLMPMMIVGLALIESLVILSFLIARDLA